MRRRRPFTRAERIGSLMHAEVERIVAFELRDKLARHVKVTSAHLSADLGHLKVRWVMDDLSTHDRAGEVLARAAGFVGRALRDTFQLRKIPKVVFLFDAEYLRMAKVRELLADELSAND